MTALLLDRHLGRSLIYNEKSRGASRLPWGTPQCRGLAELEAPLMSTEKKRLDKKSEIHEMTPSEKLKLFFYFSDKRA